MILQELIQTFKPESWGRNEDWNTHSNRLWNDGRDYMLSLLSHMWIEDSWVYGPVIVNDGVVQDGHHRIVIAASLGWWHMEVPIVYL